MYARVLDLSIKLARISSFRPARPDQWNATLYSRQFHNKHMRLYKYNRGHSRFYCLSSRDIRDFSIRAVESVRDYNSVNLSAPSPLLGLRKKTTRIGDREATWRLGGGGAY